jgi:DNA-binding NarL/FixJ family response regulator
MTIKLVVAEDDLLVREGLCALLSRDPELQLLAACGDADALLDAVAEHDPDVVITDIRMPPTKTDEGIRAAAAIRRRPERRPPPTRQREEFSTASRRCRRT